MIKNKSNKNISISCMRILSCEMINKATSGHPGICLGISPMLYVLFKNHIKLNVKDSKWYNRDRFVLSAGHGSAILYVLLHLIGYDISINDLKQFRQIDSITPGHPEVGLTDGVEAITGPLGQGIGVAVGMALAQSIKAARFNESNYNIVDNYTFAITSDGDLQEGCSYEAISLAGHWKLNKLILMYDSNDIQLDSKVKDVRTENIKKRFESSNWNYILVKNGNNEKEINEAILKAKKSNNKPTIIEIKTTIGFGSSKQGTTEIHGTPIMDDISQLKKNLNWKHDKDFFVPNEVYEDFSSIPKNGEIEYKKWKEILKLYSKKYPEKYKQYKTEINNEFNIKINDFINDLPTQPEATRISSGKIMNKLTIKYKQLIGGSADLSSSTKILGADGTYQFDNKKGRNILYGVREFAMATINNGITLYGGTLAFSSGFFVFSDYMKPAIRLASMMQMKQLYLFTHDSILVGEDGPTHQPIEQLAIFRAQPNINVFRPADFKETLGAYIYALNKSPMTPTMIILSRQSVSQLDETKIQMVSKGAYILHESFNSKITIISTGSEVEIAMKVQKILSNNNISVNVVSMISQEIFDIQSENYKNQVLPKKHFKISIEFASSFGWQKYTNNGLNFSIDNFGYSAKYNDIVKKCKMSVINIAKQIIEFLNKKSYK